MRSEPALHVVVYDGPRRIGRVIPGEVGGYVALAPSGSAIGTYVSQREAIDAISNVFISKCRRKLVEREIIKTTKKLVALVGKRYRLDDIDMITINRYWLGAIFVDDSRGGLIRYHQGNVI